MAASKCRKLFQGAAVPCLTPCSLARTEGKKGPGPRRTGPRWNSETRRPSNLPGTHSLRSLEKEQFSPTRKRPRGRYASIINTTSKKSPLRRGIYFWGSRHISGNDEFYLPSGGGNPIFRQKKVRALSGSRMTHRQKESQLTKGMCPMIPPPKKTSPQ